MASALSSRLSSRVPAYASLPRHHKLDLDSRLGSNLHAVASTALAVVCVLSLWSVEASSSSPSFSSSSTSASATATATPHPPLPPLAFRTSALSFAALGLSLGYFAADLALVLLHSPALGGAEVVGHHAAALASLLVACRCATTGSADAHDALPLHVGVLNCTDEVTRLRLANVLREVPTAVAVFESTSVVPLQLVDVVALGVHPDRVLFVPTLYGSTLRYGGLWPLPRVCCWRVGLNRHTQ